MISLCINNRQINNALESVKGSGYLKTVIFSYLESYGTDYSFNQFYLQYRESEVTAVIFRYNTFIYMINNKDADSFELNGFLSRFDNCVLFCDNHFDSSKSDCKICYLMSKKGYEITAYSDVREVSDSPKIVSDLVTQNMNQSEKDDFFLNTAHQLRHKSLRSFAYYADNRAVSVCGVTLRYKGVSAIPFVYTHEHFRGNGYSKDVLNILCSDNTTEYQLLCEEHNLKFYLKCGFIQVSTCYEIRL